MHKNKIYRTKQSVFQIMIRKIARQSDLNEEFLKIRFLKAIPDSIRSVVVSHQTSNITLDEMA